MKEEYIQSTQPRSLPSDQNGVTWISRERTINIGILGNAQQIMEKSECDRRHRSFGLFLTSKSDITLINASTRPKGIAAHREQSHTSETINTGYPSIVSNREQTQSIERSNKNVNRCKSESSPREPSRGGRTWLSRPSPTSRRVWSSIQALNSLWNSASIGPARMHTHQFLGHKHTISRPQKRMSTEK